MRYLRSKLLMVVVAGTLGVTACGGNDDDTAATGDDEVSTTVAPGGDEEAASEDFGTFTVGSIVGLTGPVAQYGQDNTAAFDEYVKLRGGKFGGWEIETIHEDDKSAPDVGTTAARKLVEQDGANFLMGLTSSAVLNAVAPYAAEAGVVLMATDAGSDQLSQISAQPLFFRNYATNSQDTSVLGRYACEELGYKTAAVVANDYAYGWEGAGGFARGFEDAGCDVQQEFYSPLPTEDWAPIVQQIDDVDVVWSGTAAGDAGRFLQAYRNFGLEPALVGSGAFVDPLHLQDIGSLAEGVLSSLFYTPQLENAENEEFVAAMDAAGIGASLPAVMGWEAAMILEQALIAAGADATDPEALAEAIAAVELDSPKGPFRFDEFNQSVHDVYILEVQELDGRWVNAVLEKVDAVSQFGSYEPEAYMELPTLIELKGTWGS